MDVGACTEPGGWKFSRDPLVSSCPAHTGVVMELVALVIPIWQRGVLISACPLSTFLQQSPAAWPGCFCWKTTLKVRTFKIHEVMDMAERARTSPGKAENYLEEGRHRLSFKGLDLCTWCLIKFWEKEIGNIFISQKNWCKTCQCCS